jgi:DNA replication and repair protein RecF
MTATARAFDPTSAEVPTPTGPSVRRLTLSGFRNYEALRLDLDRAPVVLTGPNGAGKTNLLEALSFLAPGRGLRRARLADIDRLDSDRVTGETQKTWAISAEVEGNMGRTIIGTGRDPFAAETGGDKRLVRIDGSPAKSQTVLGDHLAISWLTPQMDRLFTEGAGQRRRFLDRLVYAFDSQHAGRMNSYTHTLRERGRLLRQGRSDASWKSKSPHPASQSLPLDVSLSAG